MVAVNRRRPVPRRRPRRWGRALAATVVLLLVLGGAGVIVCGGWAETSLRRAPDGVPDSSYITW